MGGRRPPARPAAARLSARRRTGAAAPVEGRWPVAGGTASLVNDPAGGPGWLLAVDDVPQSHVDLVDPTVLVFEYVRWVGALVDALAPSGAPVHSVHVGAGAGTLARYVAAVRPGSRQVVLDPDGPLLDVVRDQLGLRSGPHLKVRAVDGRDGLAALRPGGYGLVVRDAFADAQVPHRLRTRQWVEAVARVLSPDGVVVHNLMDVGALTTARAEVATVRSLLPHVVAVVEPSVLRGRRTGNVLLVASAVPLPDTVRDRWARALHGDAAAPVRLLDEAATRDRLGGGELLDDDAPGPPPPPRPSWR
ncbi:fused MFS/spermidine synthase [Aquipuribacter nitratireducens]|uniref:Spermidine synthase n=1 Tax=Aquipuribacter nitratireducens TaxID=650104 RepID=A0ABW0GN97_9MICO